MSQFNVTHLLPAWVDPVHDAHAAFRCILAALAAPGSIQTLPLQLVGPAPLDSSTTAVLLALCDFETAVWLDDDTATAGVEAYLRFHCGCPLVAQSDAANFAVVTNLGNGLNFDQFAQGDMAFPDRSATMVIQVGSLTMGDTLVLVGPGIEKSASLQISRLPSDFVAGWQANHAKFPLGVDVIFCCGNQIIGLPRTIVVEGASCT